MSFAANYRTIYTNKIVNDPYHIISLSVQVLTSSELAMLIYKNEILLNNMLDVFDEKMS
jgi:hypothetical protein